MFISSVFGKHFHSVRSLCKAPHQMNMLCAFTGVYQNKTKKIEMKQIDFTFRFPHSKMNPIARRECVFYCESVCFCERRHVCEQQERKRKKPINFLSCSYSCPLVDRVKKVHAALEQTLMCLVYSYEHGNSNRLHNT